MRSIVFCLAALPIVLASPTLRAICAKPDTTPVIEGKITSCESAREWFNPRTWFSEIYDGVLVTVNVEKEKKVSSKGWDKIEIQDLPLTSLNQSKTKIYFVATPSCTKFGGGKTIRGIEVQSCCDTLPSDSILCHEPDIHAYLMRISS